jgi:uncharacterized protein YggT (Ycf19 family)
VFILLYRIINIIFNLATAIVLLYVVATWIVKPNSQILNILNRVAEPIIQPFRPIAAKLTQKGVMLDLSPVLAVIGLSIVRWVLLTVISWFF